jgi:hypothetical protein
MIINFNNFLNENPDTTYIGSDVYKWNDSDAIAFGYYNGRMIISEFGESHYSLLRMDRNEYADPGRIWKNKKIISFWILDKNLLKNVVIDINSQLKKMSETNNKYNFQIDDAWRIEVALINELNDGKENSHFYNLFEFISIAPKGYNDKYTVNWNVASDMVKKAKNKKFNIEDSANIRW